MASGSIGRVAVQRFSLPELIVVVAIVFALVATIMPSLHAAKDKAVRTLCVANQFQLGVGVANYAMIHDDVLVPAEYPEENWQNTGTPVYSGAGAFDSGVLKYSTNAGRNQWGFMEGEVAGSIPFNPNNSTADRNWEFVLTYISDDGSLQTVIIGRDTVAADIQDETTGTAVSIVVRPQRNDPDYDVTVDGVAMSSAVQGYEITGAINYTLHMPDDRARGGKGRGQNSNSWLLDLEGDGMIRWGDPPAYLAPFPWWGLATYYGGHTPIYDMTFHTTEEQQFYHCPAAYDVHLGGYMLNGYASSYTRDPWTREYGPSYSQIGSLAEPSKTAMILDDTYSDDGESPPFGGTMSDRITYRWSGQTAWRSTLHHRGSYIDGVITYSDGHTAVRHTPYIPGGETIWAGIYSADRNRAGKLYIMPY